MQYTLPNPVILATALVLIAIPVTGTPAVGQSQLALKATQAAPASFDANLHLDRARSLAILGRFHEAREEYARAAEIQRAQGILPTDALWQIAQIHHADENYRRAAEVLSSLAREAELIGDPAVQARALLEASILFQVAGMPDAMLAAVARLQQLRSSPYLTDDLRAAIDTRVKTS